MPLNGSQANNPQPLIATPDEIVGPAIDALVALRPAALQHINYGDGVYSHIFVGLRAQAALALKHLTTLALSKRLITDDKTDLVSHVASEFDTDIDPSPTTAVGELTLTRPAGTRPAGVIRKGSLFPRAGDPIGAPVTADAAQYEAIEDTPVALGAASVDVKIRATRSGKFANHLNGQVTKFTASTQLFDRTFTVLTVKCAGGSDGIELDDIRKIARARAVGKDGATDDEARAIALLFGARHVATADNPNTGQLVLYPTDVSWAYSQMWFKALDKYLRDNDAVGNGCVLGYRGTTNQFVHVAASVMLRDASMVLSDTTEITAAIQKAARSYLDDRDDWWTWTTDGLKAAISRAHPSILVCSSVTMSDAASGTTIPQPSSVLDGTADATHYYLADNSCSISYVSPD